MALMWRTIQIIKDEWKEILLNFDCSEVVDKAIAIFNYIATYASCRLLYQEYINNDRSIV